MKNLLSGLFKWPNVIATVFAIGMAIALVVLAYRTRNDPFPTKPVPAAR